MFRLIIFFGVCSVLFISVVDADMVVTTSQLSDRWFITPEVWANPWENWRVEKGEIVTAHRSPNQPMTIHHLTYQLSDVDAAARMHVRVRLLDIDKEGSAGFALGIRMNDPIDDYRSRLLFGEGVYAGITAEGELFVGPENRAKLAHIGPLLQVLLSVTIEPEGNGLYVVTLIAADENDGKELGRVTKKGVAKAQMTGNVALVSNAPRQVANCKMDALWAFSDWTLSGEKFTCSPDRAFGPILWAQYTLSKNIMKLTAQIAPISEKDNQTVILQLKKGNGWEDTASTEVKWPSWTAPFRVENWNDTVDTPYRIVYVQQYCDGNREKYTFEGIIRHDPVEKQEISCAVFCCFTDFLFPNRCIAKNTAYQNPDVLFFTGDQIYEGVGGWGILRTGPIDRMCVNYLRKLALWGWSFRDIMRDRPTVTMPDDHDVYHGNVWGDSGRKIEINEWNEKSGYGNSTKVGSVGGYVQPIGFVKAVEATQTSHLPDPTCTKTFKQGLGAYFTSMNYGQVGFAILEDRKFKTGPMQIAKRHKGPRPDHISEPDMADDVNDPDAKLLGDDQLDFLWNWVADWHGQEMKAAVSQTGFCGAATHHGEYDNFLLGDMDSGGWPQEGRRKALDVLRRGGVIQLAGDQHLTTLIRQGIDAPGDSIVSFVVPAGATGYQRWWRPEDMSIECIAGGRHDNRPDTGLYRDGFGNIVDVIAVGNPEPTPKGALNREDSGRKKASGWGLVSFNKESGDVHIESWHIHPGLDVCEVNLHEDQFPGWPATVNIEECYGITAKKLPPVTFAEVNGLRPVVRVTDANGNFVSAGRMHENTFVPTVYAPGSYTVEILSPEDDQTVIMSFTDLKPVQ